MLHIVLAHHGSLEHGSPVVPCTREATLVHMIDNLGGRLGSFDRLEKSLAPGRRWSSFDRALDTSAFFAGPPGDEGTAEERSSGESATDTLFAQSAAAGRSQDSAAPTDGAEPARQRRAQRQAA